jgi:site-specific recombinase XerD
MEKAGKQPKVVSVRMRIAITLLFITGGRISEILTLKKEQLSNFFFKSTPLHRHGSQKMRACKPQSFFNSNRESFS